MLAWLCCFLRAKPQVSVSKNNKASKVNAVNFGFRIGYQGPPPAITQVIQYRPRSESHACMALLFFASEATGFSEQKQQSLKSERSELWLSDRVQGLPFSGSRK
jgi:hypothetical protein